jgi:hypothetical protein
MRANRIIYELVTSRYGLNANAYYRRVAIPFPDDDEKFAGCLHEIGHVLCGTCPETYPHENVISLGNNNCLRCEWGAWSVAMKLVPFTATMFAHMQYCLSSYRDNSFTPQPAAAARAADQMMNYLESYATPLQRRIEMEHRQELVRMWRQDVNDHLGGISLAQARARLAKALR